LRLREFTRETATAEPDGETVWIALGRTAGCASNISTGVCERSDRSAPSLPVRSSRFAKAPRCHDLGNRRLAKTDHQRLHSLSSVVTSSPAAVEVPAGAFGACSARRLEATAGEMPRLRAADGIRTRDIQLGKLVLYQLSYRRMSGDYSRGGELVASDCDLGRWAGLTWHSPACANLPVIQNRRDACSTVKVCDRFCGLSGECRGRPGRRRR
jgi:hypothetical protein